MICKALCSLAPLPWGPVSPPIVCSPALLMSRPFQHSQRPPLLCLRFVCSSPRHSPSCFYRFLAHRFSVQRPLLQKAPPWHPITRHPVTLLYFHSSLLSLPDWLVYYLAFLPSPLKFGFHKPVASSLLLHSCVSSGWNSLWLIVDPRWPLITWMCVLNILVI